MNLRNLIWIAVVFTALVRCDSPAETPLRGLSEINREEIQPGSESWLIQNVTVISGKPDFKPMKGDILIENGLIVALGSPGSLTVPPLTSRLDLSGKYLLPGLIDAHFHLGPVQDLLPIFLAQGVTSLRDPGAWNESYLAWRKSGRDVQRLFLTGPHLDRFPPAHPANALIVQDEKEAEWAVREFIASGASAIKVYFRLPLGTIEVICRTAHQFGVPVTAHLEITQARAAVEAGLDGIEHITSFGTSLLPLRDAEKYRQLILGDNKARDRGRYEMWHQIDLEDSSLVNPLVRTLKSKMTVVSPNLAVFEKQADRGDSIEVSAFARMLDFTGILADAGIDLVVGSHTFVPYAPLGLGYAREMELMVEAGITAAEVIQAATWKNARFFRIEERLGTVEPGKIADLIILGEDPLRDIGAFREIESVMLAGRWVKGHP